MPRRWREEAQRLSLKEDDNGTQNTLESDSCWHPGEPSTKLGGSAKKVWEKV